MFLLLSVFITASNVFADEYKLLNQQFRNYVVNDFASNRLTSYDDQRMLSVRNSFLYYARWEFCDKQTHTHLKKYCEQELISRYWFLIENCALDVG